MWHANGNYMNINEGLQTNNEDNVTRNFEYKDLNEKEKKSVELLQRLIGVSPGAVNYYAIEKPPIGWLPCDGTLVSQKKYNRLFEAIKWIYTKEDEMEELDQRKLFRLPDFRGVFIRCFDNNTNMLERLDKERTPFWNDKINHNLQEDKFKSHTHTVTCSKSGQHNHGGFTNFDGQHSHGYKDSYWSEYLGSVGNNLIGSSGGNDNDNKGYQMDRTTDAGNSNHKHTITNDGEHSHTVTIDNTGTTETQPKNKPLMAFIKY